MAKHGVIGLMRTLANELAPHFIRANSIHPSSTFTKMINNAAIWEVFAPGVENPTEADFGDTFTALNLLPIPWMLDRSGRYLKRRRVSRLRRVPLRHGGDLADRRRL
jgi:NAD(P)-dependent dehydrogenase (short-subunit alcohol dehydrogenase family)